MDMSYDVGKNFEVIQMKLDAILEKLEKIAPEEKQTGKLRK